MPTANIPAGQSHEQDPIDRRWQALQERCIAISGKTLTDLDADEIVRVVNLFSTEDRAFAFSQMERFATQREISRVGIREGRRLRAQIKSRRAAFERAFTLNNDDLDVEKAIRSAALLLELSSDCGNDTADGTLALGIAKALSLIAARLSLQTSRAQLQNPDSKNA